jgi:cytochrome c-type biogenesis protein CcmF
LVGSFTLFSTRADLVASSPRLETFVSREGTFLLNNLLLSIYAVVVLVGTTYPLVLEAFTGTQVGVGEPFFNRLAVPLSFLLLLVMGFGPITPWKDADPGLIWRRTRGPALLAVAGGLATALFVTRNGWIVLSIVLGLFVSGTIIGLALEQTRRRSAKTGATVSSSLRQVFSGDGAFWAGQLSHIGVVLVAVGISFATNLGAHATVEMSPGDSTTFEGHTITYESPFQQTSPSKTVVGARFTVTDGDSLTGMVEPSINLFGSEQSAVGTPDVLHGPGGDLYVTLEDFPDDTGAVEVSLDTSPMIWVLWLGGLIVATGGFLAVLARRRERRTAKDRATVDV